VLNRVENESTAEVGGAFPGTFFAASRILKRAFLPWLDFENFFMRTKHIRMSNLKEMFQKIQSDK
jgi:hypothetical protein